MEARDPRSRIRPLPIDDIDGEAPHPGPVDPQRRWLPLLAIVLGALVFAIVTRGFGPTPRAELGDATTTAALLAEEPAPTTTTEPPPPTLRQLLPFVDEGLRLVTLGGSASVGRWEADLSFPSYGVSVGRPATAAYNADGSMVAVQSRIRGGSIVIDAAGGGSQLYLHEDIVGGIWHPTDPTLFAWTVFPTGGDGSDKISYLWVADISGFSGTGLEPLVGIELAGGPHRLEAWGDWGFVTSDLGRPDPTTIRFDPDGVSLAELEGAFFDATAAGTLLMARHDSGAGFLPYLTAPDGTETELLGLDIAASEFLITPDGEWVMALTVQPDGHTSILARTVGSRGPRLTSINAPARVVDLSPDNRFVILQEEESGDLVFKDWNTGAEYRLPMDRTVGAIWF